MARLQVDDSLRPLDAVLCYSRSELEPQRHAYIRGIGAVARQAAEDLQSAAAASRAADATQSSLQAGACTGEASEPAFTAAADLDRVVELVLELLAPGGPWAGDPDTLLLTLEHLQPLGEALACAAACGHPWAVTHLGHLSDSVAELLACWSAGPQEDEVAHECGVALATLLACLPPSQACAAAVHNVHRIQEGCAKHHLLLCTELLGHFAQRLLSQHLAAGPAVAAAAHAPAGGNGLSQSPPSAGLQGANDKLMQVAVGDLVTQVTHPDADEAAQQALLQYLVPLGLLLQALAPHPRSTTSSSETEGQRSPSLDLLTSTCTALSSNPLWNVRAAVANGIPGAVAAAAAAAGQAPNAVAAGGGPAGTAPAAAPTAAAAAAAVNQLCGVLCDVLGKDVSQWVRSAAIKAAGPTLTSLPAWVEAPPSLLTLYCQCVGGVRPQPPDVLRGAAACLAPVAQRVLPASHPSTSSQQAPSSLTAAGTGVPQPAGDAGGAGSGVSASASGMPATAQQLVDVYQGLLASGDGDTVRCLVQQLPQLVALLGQQAALQHLLPPLQQLQPQELQGLARQALVPCLADLLKVLPAGAIPATLAFALSGMQQEGSLSSQQQQQQSSSPSPPRLSASGVLAPTASDDGSHVGKCGAWRDRLALAQQLHQLAASALGTMPSLVETSLLPCAAALCHDPVWAVRQVAAQQLGMVLSACAASCQQHQQQTEAEAAAADTQRQAEQCDPQLLRRVQQAALQAVLQLVGLSSEELGGQQGCHTTGRPAAGLSSMDQADGMPVPCHLVDLQLFAAACTGYSQQSKDTGTEAIVGLHQVAEQLEQELCAAQLQTGFKLACQLAQLLCTQEGCG